MIVDRIYKLWGYQNFIIELIGWFIIILHYCCWGWLVYLLLSACPKFLSHFQMLIWLRVRFSSWTLQFSVDESIGWWLLFGSNRNQELICYCYEVITFCDLESRVASEEGVLQFGFWSSVDFFYPRAISLAFLIIIVSITLNTNI